MIVNIKREPCDVYCGRIENSFEIKLKVKDWDIKSPEESGLDGYFGNPHKVGYCGICREIHSRSEAILKFKEYFYRRMANDSKFRRRIEMLRNKRLGCFCAPSPCHVNIIEEYLNI